MIGRLGLQAMVLFGVAAWTCRGAANSDSRFHLGLETSIYAKTSLEGTITSDSTSGSANTQISMKGDDSQFGLPGSSAISLGVLLSDHIDLGARFGYTSQTSQSGSSSTAPTVETSALQFDPYVAYLAGSSGDSLRLTIGLLGGLGSGSVKSTSPSSSGSNSTSYEVSTSTKEYGGFLGVRGFVNEVVSIDPMLVVMATSGTGQVGTLADVSMSGSSVMLNIGFTLWTGGDAPAPTTKRQSSAPVSTEAAAAAQAGGSSEPQRVVRKPKSGPVTLSFGNERTITFIRDKSTAGATVTMMLRDPGPNNNIATCGQITLHAANQTDTVVEAVSGTASSMALRFPVLNASVPAEKLKLMAIAPIANNASVPEHWIDVCDQRWKIFEDERLHLKEFIDSLPAASSPSDSDSTSEATAPTNAATSPAPQQ